MMRAAVVEGVWWGLPSCAGECGPTWLALVPAGLIMFWRPGRYDVEREAVVLGCGEFQQFLVVDL